MIFWIKSLKTAIFHHLFEILPLKRFCNISFLSLIPHQKVFSSLVKCWAHNWWASTLNIYYQILLKLIFSPRGPKCALNFLREALLLATPKNYNPLLDPSQWINSPQAVLWLYLTSSISPCQLATGFQVL